MSFISFLTQIGKDFEKGLAELDPWIKQGIAVAQAAELPVSAIDPAIGVIFQTVVATVSSIEQKFAAMGKQGGTGTQKLAEAVTILQPVVSQAFAAAGKASDVATVSNYISKTVDFLNAIPAFSTPVKAA